QPTMQKPRVPSGLPKSKAKRDEDVHQWMFQVETLCRINGHDATSNNDTFPAVAGTAMKSPHQKLRQPRQIGYIEEYNGKYSPLIFRAENMSELDQVSYYGDGLKHATQAYVKLHNTTSLSEAMDSGAKYEMSHFGGENRARREKPEREHRFRGPSRLSSFPDKKPISKPPYKPNHTGLENRPKRS
ncbi:hypothetical protein PHMEG_00033165, partial [Phytophthora megakarya]